MFTGALPELWGSLTQVCLQWQSKFLGKFPTFNVAHQYTLPIVWYWPGRPLGQWRVRWSHACHVLFCLPSKVVSISCSHRFEPHCNICACCLSTTTRQHDICNTTYAYRVVFVAPASAHARRAAWLLWWSRKLSGWCSWGISLPATIASQEPYLAVGATWCRQAPLFLYLQNHVWSNVSLPYNSETTLRRGSAVWANECVLNELDLNSSLYFELHTSIPSAWRVDSEHVLHEIP